MSDEADWQRLAADAREFGLSLTDPTLASLARYFELLREWNRKFNLTALDQPEQIVSRHFLDSLTCARAVDFHRRNSLIDVGTGAGFPGLVLKIVFPHLRVTLLDSMRKRLGFLDRVCAALELTGVETVHARSEDAARDPRHREQYEVVTARAVARLNVLAEWTLPFARVGGVLLAMKGPAPGKEVAEAARALKLLGGGAARIHEFVLPRTDVGRSLVCVPKTQATPAAYPRLPGTARKHPL